MKYNDIKMNRKIAFHNEWCKVIQNGNSMVNRFLIPQVL